MIRIVRFREPDNEPRLGLLEPDAPTTVTELESDDVLAVLRGSRDVTGRTIEALDAETLDLPPPFELLVPLVPPETWAAGVTYERSRDARVDESQVEARDVYSLVYEGERPELFMKDADGRRTVGPAIALPDDWSQPFEIELRLLGPDGIVIYEARTSTARMRRSFEELAAWVVRENPVPAGSVLLTGTGLVPPDDVALVPGQQVEIRIPGIGKLVNPVGAAADLLPAERSKTHVR